MKRFRLVATVLVFCTPAMLLAQATTPPPGVESPAPNDVNGRLNRLEMEAQALRAEVQYLRDHPVPLPPVDAKPVGTIPDPAAASATVAATPMSTQAAPEASSGAGAGSEYYTIDELRDEMRKFAWRKGDFSIVPYGILWGNSVYDTERTSPAGYSYTLFAKSPSAGGVENECIVDARNTRLGVDVGGPQCSWLGGMQTGGKVEVDFQNSVLSTENKSTILLRHAYAEATNDDWRLLAGQTWDVISPLNPDMLLYSVGWDGGNIGYRRAQLRAERYLHCSDTSLVTLQLSLNDQVFGDTTATDVGTPSNWPIVEGRVAWTIGQRGMDCNPIIVGVSGHIGNVESETTTDINVPRRTWSGNIDVRVPITERFGVQGECFVGENLGAFLGGIGQGIDATTLNTIRDAGGWIEVWYDWTSWLHTHVGYSVDNPNDHDISTVGEKTYNQFYYGNVMYDVTKTCMVGFEVSSWETLYDGELPGDSVRCEFAVKYGF